MILLILIAGLILRLVSLNQSLWLDEATSALVAQMSTADIFGKFLPGDFHPPLYYILLKYWGVIFGYSEISLRAPSVIFGVLTIYFVYKIGKEFISLDTGLFSASFTATSGLLIYYSQEARMYAMAAMLITASVYFFLKKRWIFFGIALALTGMADYVSLLILPVFLIADRKNNKNVIASLTALFAVFLFWFPVFIKQLSAGFAVRGSAWWNILGTVSFKNIALIPVKFMIGRISFDNKMIYGVVVAVSLAFFGYLLYRARKAGKPFWYWLIVPVTVGIALSFLIPTLTYFRFLFCMPAFYILAAAGIEKLGKFKYAALVFVLGINTLSSFYYLTNYKFQREDWRGASFAIGNDKVIFPNNSHEEALIYYGKEGQITQPADLGSSDTTVWLSRYVVEITDPTDLTRLKLESLGYTKTGEYSFNGVVLWKYSKNRYVYRKNYRL